MNSKTADGPRQPPPETQESIWLRRAVIASFWAVVVFLGLPVWWKTTAIYRADLPLQDMTAWANAKVCRPVFPLRIAVVVDSVLPLHDAHHLLRVTQHALDDLNDFSAHHLRLTLSDPPAPASVSANASQQAVAHGIGPAGEDDTAALSVRLIPVETGPTPRSELRPYSPLLDVYYSSSEIPSAASTSSPLATYIAQKLHQVFAEEQAQLAYLLSSSTGAYAAQPKSLSPEIAARLQRQSALAFKSASTYHLTFSLFTTASSPSAWDIRTALDQYMTPILESFSSIANFTVDTQVQLYARFSPSVRHPEYDHNTKVWTILKEDVRGFINAAEWPLSPSIGSGRTMNFVLFVPDVTQAPLLVQESSENSWLVPQWGGIMILNPPFRKHASAVLQKDDLAPAMRTFSSHLNSLLGLPPTPASVPLRISTLTRVQTTSLILSASSTLGALAQVYRNLPSIPVPDSVAKSVDLSLAHLLRACDRLRDGHFSDALVEARIAHDESEKAFFERSMVGQVYFPDEHKIAVYLPLLGPIAVPLVMAALKELKTGFATLRGS